MESNDGHHDSSGYILVKKSKGIELYEKWHEITTDRMAREVKVMYTIHASAASAVSLLSDEAKATQWNKGSSMYQVITKDDHSWISYIQYDLPWPVDNQDCVLQYNSSYTINNHIVINFKSVEHVIFPSSKNISRITDIRGKWIFRETSEGLRVEYSITTTPSLTLPHWLTDPLVRNNLIDTMDEFRNILETSKN
ncbi:MAG: START domain-containing protein [Bacteroidota bacterium]